MKYEYYQDEKGNVYKLTTDLEQLIIHDLYKAMVRNNEKQEEIEKLKGVIKEVREYIKECCYDYEFDTYSNMFSTEVKGLLEILDKVGDIK